MERLPTPVSWPGESHGPCSKWDCKELDTTERLSLSVISIDVSIVLKCLLQSLSFGSMIINSLQSLIYLLKNIDDQSSLLSSDFAKSK